MRCLSSSILSCLLAGALVGACSNDASYYQGERPNVVLLIIDTLRADKLSSYGYPADTSPALTRLSEKGVQFDSVTAQTSWTLPSIGSMLASRYPRSLGLYKEEAQRVPDSAEMLAEVLKRAGYATYGITANPNLNKRYNFHQGFDEYHESIVVFTEEREDVPEGKIHFTDASLRTAPDIADSVIEFAQEFNGESPCFIFIDLMEVHEHAFGKLRRPEYDDLFEDEPSKDYLQMVRQVTDDIGVFVERLSVLPGWENTLFVFTSDHGEGLLDHPNVIPSMGHGSLLYRSHVSVPWIMYSPSWRPVQAHVSERVRLLDLVPTILDYVNVESPPILEGVSVLPLVEGKPVALPPLFVTETYFRDFRKLSAIGSQWQLIENRARHRGLPLLELQEWGEPPNGKYTDKSAIHPSHVKRMREYLLDWESKYDRASRSVIEEELDDATRSQLEAVGYLGGDDEE